MTLLRAPSALRKRQYSLSALLGGVILASILPLLILGIYGLSRYVADQNADQLHRMTRYTEALSSAIDRELTGYRNTAEVLAASRFLADGDLKAFGQLARDAATKAEGHFVLIDPSGRQVVNTRLPEDVNLPNTEDMESLNQVLQTGRPAVSGLFVGAVSNQLLFVIRVPVVVDGAIRYVLSFEPGPDVVYNVIRQMYVPDGWLAAVLDGNGRIVARSHRHESFYGQSSTPEFFARLAEPSGVIESVDLEGRAVVTNYRLSGLTDWRVLVWAPKSLLDAPMHRFLLLTMGLAALTLLVSFAAAYLVGRIIARPIRQLLKAARALEAGEPVRFRTTHQREVNVVGFALAEAARSIASREQALRKSELHSRFVMRELSHRSKNLLAIIQAIARQTGRTAQDVGEFNERFGERLAGIGRSQDLLVQKNWEGVSIKDLISAQLKPFIDGNEPRVTVSGPPLLLSSDAAQNLGMALHELGTNASKHGALSVPSGRVKIEWEWRCAESGGRRLQVRWQESGGPPVKQPSRKGFGHVVIENLAAASLHGTAQLDWRPEGLVWTMDVPESCLAEPRDHRPDDAQAASGVGC